MRPEGGADLMELAGDPRHGGYGHECWEGCEVWERGALYELNDGSIHIWNGDDDWDVEIKFDGRGWAIKETIWGKSRLTGKGNYFSREIMIWDKATSELLEPL